MTSTSTNTGTPTPSCFYTPSPFPRNFPKYVPIDWRSLLHIGWPEPGPDPAPFDFRSTLPAGLPEFGQMSQAGDGFFQTVTSGQLRATVADSVNQLASVSAPANSMPLYGSSLAMTGPDGSDVTLLGGSVSPFNGASMLSFTRLNFDGSVDIETPALGAMSKEALQQQQGGGGPRQLQNVNGSPSGPQWWGGSAGGSYNVTPAAAVHLGDDRSYLVIGRDGGISLIQRSGKYWDSYNARLVVFPPVWSPTSNLPPVEIGTLQLGFASIPSCSVNPTNNALVCTTGDAAGTSFLFARGNQLFAQSGVVDSARDCGKRGLCSWPAQLKSPVPSPRPLLAASGLITSFVAVPPPSSSSSSSSGVVDFIVGTSLTDANGGSTPVLEVYSWNPATGRFALNPSSPLFRGSRDGRMVLDNLASPNARVLQDNSIISVVGAVTLLPNLGPCYLQRYVVLTIDSSAFTLGSRRLSAGYTPGGSVSVTGTRLVLVDPNQPVGSNMRIRVINDGSGGISSNRPTTAVLPWPQIPPRLFSPSATVTPRGFDGKDPVSATPSPLALTPPPTRSMSQFATRYPSATPSPRVPWDVGNKGDTVLVLTAVTTSAVTNVVKTNGSSALAVRAYVGSPDGGRIVGTLTASLALPAMTSESPDEQEMELCTLPAGAPVAGLGALAGDPSFLPVACMDLQSGNDPRVAGAHAFMAIGGEVNIRASAHLGRSAGDIAASSAVPLSATSMRGWTHLTSISIWSDPNGPRMFYVSNGTGVYALIGPPYEGTWDPSSVTACGICGASNRLCVGGVSQVLHRQVGYFNADRPGAMILFATTNTAVLYASVPNPSSSACKETGSALAGVTVSGAAFRGLSFATDASLFVADAIRGLLRFDVPAGVTGVSALSAKWNLTLTSSPAKGAGLLGVLYHNSARSGACVYATSQPLGVPAAQNALYRYNIPARTWTLIAAAPAGGRFLGVFDPPFPPGVNAVSATPAMSGTPTPTRSVSASRSVKPKI